MPSSSSSSGEALEDELTMEAAAAVCSYVQSLEETPVKQIRGPDLPRDRETANMKLMEHYFNDDATYADKFKNRFRMSKELFLKIANDLEQHDDYFKQKIQGKQGTLGFTKLQKCIAAIRQLGYELGGDTCDDYLAMAEKTSHDSLEHFCQGVNALYGAQYLRKPTSQDIQQLYEAHEEIPGLPGMLGSLDCTQWEWANFPTAWRGQYQRGDHPHPTVMLEAVASHDFWIWHAFFGAAGSNNDINVLNQSPIFGDIIDGVAPGQTFYVSDNEYKYGYYLVDGIYPEYATFVKAYTAPTTGKRNFLKQDKVSKERYRTCIRGSKEKMEHSISPSRFQTKERMGEVMYTCIILHNMIFEAKERTICTNYVGAIPRPPITISTKGRLRNRREMRSRETHGNLRHDLMEHLWSFLRPFDG